MTTQQQSGQESQQLESFELLELLELPGLPEFPLSTVGASALAEAAADGAIARNSISEAAEYHAPDINLHLSTAKSQAFQRLAAICGRPLCRVLPI
jgi:hypothetical protein